MRKLAPLLLLLASVAAAAAPSCAQNSPSPTSMPARTGGLEGTVRDSSGQPVANVTVTLIPQPNPGAAKVLYTKTAVDGTFTFSAISPGLFTVQAEIAAAHTSATRSVKVSAGETQHIELVLAEQNSSASPDGAKSHVAAAGTANPSVGPAADALQLADEPNFTVSGMTDWSNFGLHGSDAAAKTSEALTRETLALKPSGIHGNAVGDGGLGEVNTAAGNTRGGLAAAHRLAGDRDERSGDPVAAVREYETAARLDPDEENYFAWGSELLLHRAAQPAAEVFAKGAAAHPDSSRMLAGLGAALYADGQYDDAARKLCAASDLNPADATPYMFLGKMEETATAAIACGEEKLARFAQQEPANALANYYYALSLTKRERVSEDTAEFSRIEALLEKSLALDPQFGEAYVQLGILYSEKGALARAEEVLKKAVAAKPDLGLAHYRLGQAYKRSGEQALAQQEFARYAQCEKGQADAREREQRELRQFLVILKDSPTATQPK